MKNKGFLLYLVLNCFFVCADDSYFVATNFYSNDFLLVTSYLQESDLNRNKLEILLKEIDYYSHMANSEEVKEMFDLLFIRSLLEMNVPILTKFKEVKNVSSTQIYQEKISTMMVENLLKAFERDESIYSRDHKRKEIIKKWIQFLKHDDEEEKHKYLSNHFFKLLNLMKDMLKLMQSSTVLHLKELPEWDQFQMINLKKMPKEKLEFELDRRLNAKRILESDQNHPNHQKDSAQKFEWIGENNK